VSICGQVNLCPEIFFSVLGEMLSYQDPQRYERNLVTVPKIRCYLWQQQLCPLWTRVWIFLFWLFFRRTE